MPAAVLRLVSDGVATPASGSRWGCDAELSCGKLRSATVGCLPPFGRACTHGARSSQVSGDEGLHSQATSYGAHGKAEHFQLIVLRFLRSQVTIEMF